MSAKCIFTVLCNTCKHISKHTYIMLVLFAVFHRCAVSGVQNEYCFVSDVISDFVIIIK